MSKPRPRATNLPLKDPVRLLEALQGDVDPSELLCAFESYAKDTGRCRSVATYLLQGIVANGDDAAADAYLACCKRMFELDAPFTDMEGEGVEYTFSSWLGVGNARSVERMNEVADLYFAASAFDVNRALPGERLARNPSDRIDFSPHGHKPLSVAIFLANPRAVRYLLERGASLELGNVYPGEPPMTAMELAIEEGYSEIQTVIAEFTMRRRLACTDTPTKAPTTRRRLSL